MLGSLGGGAVAAAQEPEAVAPEDSAEPTATAPTAGADSADATLEQAPAGDKTRTASAGPRLTEVSVAHSKFFFAGRRRARVTYAFAAPGPRNVRIRIVHIAKAKVVRILGRPDRDPGTRHRATWDGRTERGRVAPNGQYKFRVIVRDGAGRRDAGEARFFHYGHKFPVRGPHAYGDGIGAPRGDRRHQGQDITAACGTRLEAARGGVVQWKAYQAGGAGYYLVIDGDGTGDDYAYMHLAERSPFRTGDRVLTGQRIGSVGETGNARGCHLHFEIWTAPGWYEGGAARDPRPDLERWASS